MSADDVQSEILQRLTRVETKLDMQINAKDMAAETLEKASQHTCDKMISRFD